MSWVGLRSKSIYNENIKVLEQSDTGKGDLLHVADIGQGVASGKIEAESEGLDRWVCYGNGCDEQVLDRKSILD